MSVPLAGEWVPLPGVGDQCIVRMAKDPATLLPAFDWEPCTDAGLGCERIRVPRVGSSGFDDFGLGIRQGIHVDGGGVHLALQRKTSNGYLRTVHTVGQPGLFAFYFDDKQTCVADANVTAAGIALFVSTTGSAGPSEQLQRHLLRSRYEEPLALSTIDMSARVGGLWYGIGMVGDGFVSYVSERVVGLFGIGATSPVASAPRRNEMPVIVRGGIVTSDELDTALDYYSVSGEPPRRIAGAAQGASLGRLAASPTGDIITFVEQPSLVEGPLLYALPLVPANAPKRAITHIAAFSAFRSVYLTNDGFFAHTDKEGRIVVVRLSDGRSWPAISTSDGRGFRELVYVDKTSVWGIVWGQGGGAAIERHTLVGEPTIPPF